MKTWSGLDAPLLPGEGEVSILDIVVQLGRTRRFGGAGSLEWTVLHHSALVSLLWIRAGFPLELLHFALLHDAHEYVIGDIPGPVKAALTMFDDGAKRVLIEGCYVTPMKALELFVDESIREHLDLPRPGPDAETKRRIKVCDLAALLVEGVMFGAPGCDCSVDIPAEMHDEVYGLLKKAIPSRFTAARFHGRFAHALMPKGDR